ncbi:glycosyl transferase family 1 [Pseudoalteromonas luteoviolacea]|nr:glycosyl transferase family 1 [Pseudoalteromonas luteoviolacea]
MNVLYVTRPTVFSGPGGDTVQLLKTAEYLKQYGVNVTVSETSEPSFEGFDLIHFFNLRNPQDLLSNVRRAKKANIPTVLSTIWGSYQECDIKTRHGLGGFLARNVSEYKLEYLKAVARAVLNRNFSKNMIKYFATGHYKSICEIANSVDVLLPNSPTELERVHADTNSHSTRGQVVANAVDLNVFNFEKVQVTPEYEKYRGCILSAARIETRKCQLDLIRAVKGTKHQLVIVGKPSPNSIKYYEKCRAEAGDNVHFINHVSHDELAQLYKVAAVHALISWMETPGLSTLEAAVMGCNVVVTDRGDTEYYFQDFAEYVEPDDPKSILAGLERALEKPFTEGLKSRIEEHFTWKQTAKETYQGYQFALGKK